MQRPRTYPRFSFAVLVASCWVGGTFAPHCCAFQYAVEYQQYYHDHHASPQQQQRKRLLATTTAPIAFALKIPRPSSDRTITAVVPRGGDYSSPATRKAVGVACASDYGWGYYGTHHGGNTNNGMGFMFSVEMAAKGNKGKTTKNAKKGGRRAGGGSGEKVGSGSGGFGAAPPARLAATTTTTTTAAPTRAGADASVTSAAKTTGMETARVAPKATERRSPNPQQQVELPDDDFATFPPLSLATLESVMGLDVFELPAGGVAARERGQQVALPFQVLECIRDRHGMPEFGGGRQLLDDAYIAHDEGERPAAAVGGGQGESGEADERDRPRTSPLLLFPGLRLLHAEPPVIGVDDFFTSEECNAYVSKSLSPAPDPASVPHAAGKSTTAGPHMQRSATLGADVDSVAQRTSTTWFHRYSAVPELMAKASALVGIPFDEERWEEPQTVRYRPGEKFTWHLDALPPTPDLATKGGQRIVTLLVYLTDMPEGDGGATAFRDLGPLRVRPRKGSALLFFPACGGAPDCPFDVRTLHAGEVVRPGGQQDKWIAQLWLRERSYTPTVPKGNAHADASSVVAEFDATWRQAVAVER